jgi:hypothetical protein
MDTQLAKNAGTADCGSAEAHLLAQLDRGCRLAHLARITMNPDSRRNASAAAIAIYESAAERLLDLQFTDDQRGVLHCRLKVLREDLLLTGDWSFRVRYLFER